MMPRVWKPRPEDIDSYDPARKRLAALVVESEDDLSKLSTRVCGKNASYLWQYFTRRKPRDLPEDVRFALALHFGVDESALRGEKMSAATQRPITGSTHRAANGSGNQGSKLPVLGRAIAGSAKIIWENGRPQDWVERPSYVSHPDAFAVYVNGESMEPRYYAGERIYVDPSKPVSRDCFVVVECKDDTAIIKQFVKFTDDSVELRSFNPPQSVVVPRDQIRAILRIVGASER